MHQQVPTPIDQYGVQPQIGGPLVICPVQIVYDAQMVMPQTQVSENIHQQQPLLLNVQNPPPWIQNRQQNVIYVQQMPNQIHPYVQPNMIQNPIYTSPFNYQLPQQVIPQEIMPPVFEIPPMLQNKPETSQLQEAPGQVAAKMPLLTQLLNQNPVETQEKPTMQSQHVQTDFPININKNLNQLSISLQQKIAFSNMKQKNVVMKGTSQANTVKMENKDEKLEDVNKKVDDINKTTEIPSHVKNRLPGGISIQSCKPLQIRPIITPTIRSNLANPIPIKLRALDPTQVISIPNYGTLTNYTVLNEDKDVKIPTSLQNLTTLPRDKIITAKLNEKNEITFIQTINKDVTNMPGRSVLKTIPKITCDFQKTVSTADNPTSVLNESENNLPDFKNTFTDVSNQTNTVSIETNKSPTVTAVKTVPNDTPKSVSIEPETIKSIEVKKLSKKVEKVVEKESEKEKAPVKTAHKTRKVETKAKTVKDIKKKIAQKDAATEKMRKSDVFILTHVLDGHVIQESNVAFPIYAPAKENYSYEPFHEIARRRRTEESHSPLKNLQIVDNSTDPVPVTIVPPQPPVTNEPDGSDVTFDTNEDEADDVSKVTEDVKIEALNGSVEEREAVKKAKRDDNPFSMLQRSAVEKWDMNELANHLITNNWKEAAEKLKDQEIDGESLLLASKDQLVRIGVTEKQAEIINEFVVNCNTVLIESD